MVYYFALFCMVYIIHNNIYTATTMTATHSHLHHIPVGDIGFPIAGHEVGVASVAVPVAVRVCSRELHAGRVDWLLGARTSSRVEMECEAVDLPRGHAGI